MLDRLLKDDNWGCVFAEKGEDGYVAGTSVTDVVDTVGDCRPDPFTRKDVVEVLAMADTTDQEWNGWDGKGVFLLEDGRYLYAEGWCDYTGWG